MTIPGVTGAITGGHCAEFVDAFTIQDNGSACGSGGTGTVTSVSTNNITTASQNFATCSTATATTTPAITCTIANSPTHTFYGNPTTGAAAPDFFELGTSDVTPNAYKADTGAADAAIVTLAPVATALTAGLEFRFLPVAANLTTTPTVNVNGLGAKTITKNGTAALAASDLTTTEIADVVYDGTEFQLQNPATTPASGANAALSNLSGVAINAALLPGTTDTIALGSATKRWTDVFIGNGSSYSHFLSAAASARLVNLPDAVSATGQASAAATGAFLSSFSATTGVFGTKTLTNTTGAGGMTWTDAAGVVTVAPASTTGGGNAILQCTQTGGSNGQYYGISGGICQNITPGVIPNHRVCSGYTVLQTDVGTPIFCSDAGAAAVTLNSPASYSANFYFCMEADAAGTVTITASGNIDGAGTLAIVGTTKNHACVYNDGSTWYALRATGF